FFPDQAAFEAVRTAFLNLVDDILKIPSGPWVPGHFEFEEAESDFILCTVHLVEHEYEHHAMRGAPEVKGLSEPRIIVTPEVELKVVICVILQGLRRQASISAALVVIRVARRRPGADPLLLLVRGRHTAKMNRHLG